MANKDDKGSENKKSEFWLGADGTTFTTYEKIKKIKTYMDTNFPTCEKSTNKLLECEYYNPEMSELCEKNKVELAYCITESYCPREARKFFECVTRAPGLYPTSNYYPPRCQRLWNSLDKCMISFQVPDDGVTENPDERYAPDDDNDKNSFNYENFFDDD